MILLLIAIVMMIGSVAATDTASNDTITTNNNVAQATQTTTDTQTTSTDSSQTNDITSKSITKTISNESVKSSSSTAKTTSTSKSSTKTKINDITATRNSKVTFKAVVTTTSGKNVQSGTVTFKLNGKTIGKSKVSRGSAKLTYTLPSKLNDIKYTITAAYNGNSKYTESSNKGVLKLKSNLATKVTVKDITSVQGDTTTLKAVVTTSDGKYVQTGKVAFKINGKTVGTASVSNGGAKLKYTIPNSYKDKQYTITVVYGKNEYYNGAKSTGLLKLTAKHNPAIIISSNSAIAGQTTTLTAKITSKTGVAISGGKVVYKLNDKTIGSTTLSGGVAKITYSIPSSWSGNYKLSVVYEGYGKYNPAEESSTFKVIKPVTSKVTIDTTSAYSGESITFTARITDSSGNKISGGKAAFKINGKTIGRVSVTGGVAKLTYKIPSSWNENYKITVVYGGHGKYTKASATTSLTVSKKGKIVVPAGYSSYVKSTSNCQVSNSKIKSLAASLTSGSSNALSAAKSIFNYVRDKISYTLYYNTRAGAVGTLNRKYGNCVDQTHLLNALMRASNIPARYCHATCSFRSGLVTGHVWSEVYVNGRWYKCDTTSRSNSFNNIVNWRYSTTVRRYISLPF
ncbi:MAG: Ig-like domain repeat protein [Methanosphaera sp.]|nr:Ig-like domain repeat protein [Methanosphaera sp.]